MPAASDVADHARVIDAALLVSKGRVMPRLMTTRLADRVVRCLDGNLAIRTAKLCWVECSAGPLKQAKAPDGRRKSRWAIVRNTCP
jgi:hypothetical protein